MKVRLPYTKKFREACVFKKKNLQMVRTEVEEIIRKKKSLDSQEEDQALKTARIELQKARRDLYKDLGSAISSVSNYKRDISACLCGEPMKGFGCYGSNFNELLKKLPEWVLSKCKTFTSQSLKSFVDKVIGSIAHPDLDVFSEDLAEMARGSFLDGLMNSTCAKERLKAKSGGSTCGSARWPEVGCQILPHPARERNLSQGQDRDLRGLK